MIMLHNFYMVMLLNYFFIFVLCLLAKINYQFKFK
jgi:hypothetical protein